MRADGSTDAGNTTSIPLKAERWTILWERSTDMQRETIKMNYPKWSPGNLSTGMNTEALSRHAQDVVARLKGEAND